MQNSQIVSQNSNPATPSSIANKITVDLIHWTCPGDCGSNVASLDVSHWNADQVQRFWEFVHAN
jgi:hypothetical protein